MASDEERLIISLEARVTQFEKAFAKAAGTSNSAWNAIEARGKRGAANLESSFARATHGVNERFAEMAREGAGALTAALGIEKIREMADEWTSFRGKIAASGVATDDLAHKTEELADIAIRTHATLEDVATVYTALRRAAVELGASEAQTIRATETLQKALTLGGQPLATTQAAILEISHALAGGRINGQELNKLLMEAPTLVNAIAKEFGVTTGQLRALKEEGQELSADKVFAGILHGSQQIDAAFAKMTPTISQSFQMLSTSMTRYVGQADQANGFSRLVSTGIQELAHNMQLTAPIAFTLGAGLVGLFTGGPLLGGIAAATVGVVAFATSFHPIAGELATLADYARVAFELVKNKSIEASVAMTNAFHRGITIISQAMSGVGIPLESLLDAVKTVTNAVIGAFVFSAESIKASWATLPAALADGVIIAVNSVISAVEGMVNKVISAINSLQTGLGKLTGHAFNPVGSIDLGRIKNGFAGAGEQAGNAFKDAFKDAFSHDYLGDAFKGANGSLKDFDTKANQLAGSEQPPVAKPADEGSLDQSLKSSPDPKKVKAYNEIINKTKEYVQAQQLEQQALTLSAEKASSLRHEQDLYNEATAKEITLTAEQKTQIKGLADGMAQAEQATKRLTDMKDAIQQLGEQITDSLVDTFDALISRSRTWEQSLRKLGESLVKMALDAALWGKGPLAELTGTKDNGLLNGVVRDMLPKTNAKPQQFLPTPAIPLNGNATNAGAASGLGGIGSDAVASASGSKPSASTSPFGDLSAATAAFGKSAPASGGNATANALTKHLMDTYGIPHEQAVGAVGVMGYESGDFKTLQERGHSGTGSGYGYAQWTGPRRTNFMNYAKENNLEPSSYAANQGFMDHELAGPYSGTIGALKNADGVEGGAKAWLQHFEGMNITGQGKVEGVPAVAEHVARAKKYFSEGVGSDSAPQAADQTKLADAMKSTATETTSLTASLTKAAPATTDFSSGLTGLLGKLAGGIGGGATGAAAGIGSIFGFASGGHVRGAGTATSDSIPAYLSHGEFVVNAKSTSRHRGLLEAVNSGKAPRFATGGLVGGDTFANSSTFSPVTTVNLTGSGNSQQDARLADQVGNAVKAATQQRPDSFRRSGQQNLARAGAAISRAHGKNG